MNTTLSTKSKRFGKDAGIALLTTLLLLFLMSSLLVGFSVLLVSDQQLAGANNDQVKAFYAAEAGMEQMTASLGNLFSQTYSPSIGEINNLETTPPSFPGIVYQTGDGNNGYTITPNALDGYGNPAPTITTIKSGTYQGMTAMATEYTLNVNARTSTGREINLVRTTQTVGIPMFQFGIFSDTDLDFFPGPVFNFGGRTHTNGNLFLAGGSTLTLSDKVDAYKDVIRTNLENGWPTSSNYTGTVNITTSPGGNNYRALAMNEGSLVGTLGSGFNTNWPNISLGTTNYAGNLRNGQGSAFPKQSTGASQLNLGVVTIGKGATQAIDLIRRPIAGEAANITNERYFAQASLRILLSDNAADIMNLPCVDQSTQPFDLSWLAMDPGTTGTNWLNSGYVPLVALYNKMVANNVVPLPLAVSGALPGATAYNAADGYWLPAPSAAPPNNPNYAVIKGFIKIEAQTAPYPMTCIAANQKDVTVEVLALGYVGRNLNPVPQSYNGTTVAAQWVQPTAATPHPVPAGLPSFTLPYQNGATITQAPTALYPNPSTNYPGTCPDPHPNAVIRLERVRDNPSSIPWTDQTVSHPAAPLQATFAQACGYNWVTNTAMTTNPTDFWPNTLFDSREGTLREASMSAANLPTLNGTMHYIELDAKNLTRWFGGAIGTSGPTTKDAVVSPDNFLAYISDRRGNYANGQTWANNWPPLSPTNNETGEYGWDDLVNSSNAASGCPNNAIETGEDVDNNGNFYTYGANAKWIHAPGAVPPLQPGQIGIFNNLVGSGVINSTVCAAVPAYSTVDNIWPMMLAANTNAARENPSLFFRGAVKIVNGSDLTAVGQCPSSVSCGLAIAVENPVYIQGDFNANINGAQWNSAEVATSVAGDAVTLLSVQWNDLNSFMSPYATTQRNGNTTWYRTAIIGGATLAFPQPAGQPQDYGTDGGVHNFLRYIEAWGGTLEYKGSIIDLYTSRQANGTFKCCGVVYSPPSRGYNFDTKFLNPTLLPPRTPLFRDVNTTGWTRVMQPLAGQYK
ncbi:MAG TPA: PilX N-terminal domain-containing pilus assembly protein [Candidatus Binatia bacterium]|nr:PilX N-terminal domain-containing pilus assembly protein [Candidatus Binatia bacterium]